jgi:hypothetical protein
MRKWFALTFLLAGCGQAQQDTSVCDADRWTALVGKPEAALYGALPNLRVIHPGDAVTKDLNRNRLNAIIDDNGRIARFGCY